MRRLSPQRLAQGALLVLLLALLRTVGEYYRLRAALGPAAGLTAFGSYVGGLLLGLAGLTVAQVLYFGGRYRAVVATIALTLALLLAYKVRFIAR